MYIEINGLHEWRTVGVNCSLNMSIQLWLLVLYVVVACSQKTVIVTTRPAKDAYKWSFFSSYIYLVRDYTFLFFILM
jgi:hypothetical protein